MPTVIFLFTFIVVLGLLWYIKNLWICAILFLLSYNLME